MQRRNRDPEVENKHMDTNRGERRSGMNWETGIDIYKYTSLHKELISVSNQLNFWLDYFDVHYLQFSSVQSLSRVRLFATPWTVAHQVPLSMGILQARILE